MGLSFSTPLLSMSGIFLVTTVQSFANAETAIKLSMAGSALKAALCFLKYLAQSHQKANPEKMKVNPSEV